MSNCADNLKSYPVPQYLCISSSLGLRHEALEGCIFSFFPLLSLITPQSLKQRKSRVHATWIRIWWSRLYHVIVYKFEPQKCNRDRNWRAEKLSLIRKASGPEHRPDSGSSENKNIHSRRWASQQHVYTHTNTQKAPYIPQDQCYNPFQQLTSNTSPSFLK